MDQFQRGWYHDPDFKRGARTWARRSLAAARDLLITTVAAAVLLFVLFHFVRILWGVYSHTPVGKMFITEINPVLAAKIDALLQIDIRQLSLHTVFTALYTCGSVGLIARISLIKRLLFDARDLPVKLLWAGGMGLLAAPALQESVSLSFEFAYLLTVPVIMALQNSTFELASRLLPEGDLVAFYKKIRSERRVAAIRDGFD